ncbi:MAG: AAA family ATPase [Gammaproteobacteria bacterium]|nr:AAA family ATPase [Gammaproteobacteria bacterium]
MIEAFDIDALSAYKTGAFEEIARQSASDFPTYSRALIAQILAEIHNCIVEKLQLIKESTDSPFLLKKGLTIRNGNIRFFCNETDIVAGKYALLFVHKTTRTRQFFIADYDGEKTFQIGFKANSVEESLIDIQGAYNVHILASLTPYFRSYIAACQPNTNILEAIAQGKIDSYFPQDVTQSSIFPGLNESQSQALSAFTGLGQGIQIMKGPPGTGKTTTIVSMLSVLCQRNISHAKMEPILVCGPSNKSVSVIADSFRKKHPQIPIVLCEREDETAGLVKSLVDEEIKKAQIIFATLSKSGSAIITKSIKKIHALIIDEAGQASEPDMLIPFQLNPEKVLIVGDECQLPPTVLSKDPEKFNYHWSMLSRLIVECGQSHFLLNTQYRMHPEISFFPVEAFYSGQVNDGVTANDRAPKKEIISYQVLDVADGKEELDPISKSYKNIQEAFAVITLIADVLKAGYQVSDIAVITPYKAQLKLLKDFAIKHLKIENLTINTIDSFQGEESPVVFVSMVRANALGRIGFAKDFRRLNVAITRPQQILRIVMNGATFNPLHPRNEFQNSILQVFSEFHHIPRLCNIKVSYAAFRVAFRIVFSQLFSQSLLAIAALTCKMQCTP